MGDAGSYPRQCGEQLPPSLQQLRLGSRGSAAARSEAGPAEKLLLPSLPPSVDGPYAGLSA